MIIDGHGHACGNYLTCEQIDKSLKKANVDMVLLTPGELNSKRIYKISDKTKKNPQKDVVINQSKMIKFITKITNSTKKIPEGNNIIFEMTKIMPDKIKQCYWITKQNWKYIDEDYLKMKFCAVKLHQCWEKFDICSLWFEDILKWIIEKDIPLFIHMYDYVEVEKLIGMIKKYPEAKIIIAHLFGMEIFLKEDLKCLKNVYFDLSNCYFVSKERIMKAFLRFGDEKLIMGSDTPYGINSLLNTIRIIKELDISEDEKKNLLGDNLKRLLKI